MYISNYCLCKVYIIHVRSLCTSHTYRVLHKDPDALYLVPSVPWWCCLQFHFKIPLLNIQAFQRGIIYRKFSFQRLSIELKQETGQSAGCAWVIICDFIKFLVQFFPWFFDCYLSKNTLLVKFCCISSLKEVLLACSSGNSRETMKF